MADVVYPQGCRPLSEDLGTDELIRRLKALATVLQTMGQDDDLHQQYIPLALHLVDDHFLKHPSRDVQLLVACSIADVLRLYAPEAPYKDQEQITNIFQFLIKQLYGLKDPKDPSFKRYFYLLEDLAYVKAFNMCFDVEDCQKIFCHLFTMMFKTINEDHSAKVKNFMIDIMSPLITESDNFTTELLDLILINVVEPYKSQNKCAYQLAEQLIVKTSDSLAPMIKLFFNQVLVMDRVEKNVAIASKIYDLIYELNLINPDILYSVLPQLECKLRSPNEVERLKAVSLLARMFSERDSQLAKKHPALFRFFLGRFCDIAVAVRVKCVQSSMHFLLNHPHLREDIIECLRARQHDSDETVRYEVVMAIVETAKREFRIVCESQDSLHIVRERTLDKKFKIRKEAMSGLAFIYRQALCEPNDLSDDLKKSMGWIKNKILHGYYMANIEDRLLVERLLITCLVPYKLAPEERMKKLYHLLGTLDDNATKAFIELQKNQMKTRKTVADWVKLHHGKEMTPKLQNQLNLKQNIISRLLPDPIKATEYLTKFSQNMRKDPSMLRCMEIILKNDVSCKECADTMSILLKKLGTPVMTNLYYNTVKMLIERIASVMVDKESIGILIKLIENCMQRGNAIKEVGVPRSVAGESGLKLLTMLSYVFSAHFFTDTTLRHMIALLSYDEDYAAPLLLKSFTQLGRYKPLSESCPVIFEELAPVCKDFALCGTEKQAKHAVRCIFVNSQSSSDSARASGAEPYVHPIFSEIIESLRATLGPGCESQRTKIVSLGHIAYNMPQTFLTPIKNMIARRVVKDLLIQGIPEDRDYPLPEGEWCPEDELPPDTLAKLDALKTMARWLLGLKTDVHAAQKTFRMLSAFVNQRGDLLEQNRLCAAEKSWLRLGAACAMLKVCEQPGVGDQYSAEQYFNLSQVMCDPVPEVREIFARKLHKGLGKGLPSKCLPLDFMGFYAMAGHESDKRLLDKLRHFVEADVHKRREYLKTVSNTTDALTETQTTRILPDFMLAFAIPVIVHDPTYTDHQDRQQLKHVEKCLRFVLEPLMAKRDSFSYSFYTNLIQMMKNHQHTASATAMGDDSKNLKMWAACDLALYIINTKLDHQTDSLNMLKFPMSLQLPAMYYKPNDFVNTKIYIPLDTYGLAFQKKLLVASASHAAAAAGQQKGDAVSKKILLTTTAASNEKNKRAAEKRNATSDDDDINVNENSPTNTKQQTSSGLFEHLKSNDDGACPEPASKRSRLRGGNS